MFDDLIKQQDFKGIGLLTAHCNLNKLNTAINFARTFKLDQLLCYGFTQDVIDKWREINVIQPDPVSGTKIIPLELEKYVSLINGSDFLDSRENTKRQAGIKTLWIYYAYAEYVRINHFDDTPNGLVGKSNEFSIPTPTGDINNFSYKYDNMAKQIFTDIKEYLCINKDIFTKFDACDCDLSCGCSGSCSCGKIKKVTGFRYSQVKKRR